MTINITKALSVSHEHLMSHMAGAYSCRLDLEPLFRACGISEHVLRDPAARISYSDLTKLRLAICRKLDDEHVGFCKRSAPWGSTVLMCRAIVSSLTLREALIRYQRFNAILNDEMRFELCEGDRESSLDFYFENRKDIDNRAEIETKIFFLLSFSVWLTGRKFVPHVICFSFARPEFADEFSNVVRCQYRFDQPVNRIVLDSALLREHVRKSPRVLNHFLSNHLFFLINENLTDGSVADRVRQMIAASGGTYSSLESISCTLNISATTLRRRLKSEGFSLQSIKEEVRKERAIHFLIARGLSVTETAALTGFSEPAAFSRAFKLWTGKAPRDYVLNRSQANTRGLPLDENIKLP